MIDDPSMFVGKTVVVTEKLDGENTTMYWDHIHARSLDSKHHPSRTVVKQLHGQIAHQIPQGWRLCGENMYAKHSIFYDALPSYFLLFSVWNDKNECLSWGETLEWAELLGVSAVPMLYIGNWDEDRVKACWTGVSHFGPEQEGYVVRIVDGFGYDDFSKNVAKYVRRGHVQTDQFWMTQPVVPNELA
jgi:hypothetical protein